MPLQLHDIPITSHAVELQQAHHKLNQLRSYYLKIDIRSGLVAIEKVDWVFIDCNAIQLVILSNKLIIEHG